jgi:hypothetical protein
MAASSWGRSLMAGRGTPRRSQARPSARPRLEVLEDRLAPASFTVTNNADSGAGSLRAAVDAANLATGSSTITFAPSLAGQKITLTSGELAISQSMTITGRARACWR